MIVRSLSSPEGAAQQRQSETKGKKKAAKKRRAAAATANQGSPGAEKGTTAGNMEAEANSKSASANPTFEESSRSLEAVATRFAQRGLYQRILAETAPDSGKMDG